MLDSLFNQVYQSAIAAPKANDQTNRVLYPALCIVSRIEERDRTIRVADPANPQIESDWLRRLLSFPGFDPNMPIVGSTVLCLFADGLFSHGWYLQCENATNPPQEKKSGADDLWQRSPGNCTHEIKGDRLIATEGNDTESVGGDQEVAIAGDQNISVDQAIDMDAAGNITISGLNVLIKSHAGAFISFTSAGVVLIGDAFGNRVVLGGASGGAGFPSDIIMDLLSSAAARINMNNRALEIINPSSVAIANKQVATLGAVDSDGDTLVTKGWP